MAGQIDYQVADGVAQIGINRPEKKNALTTAMYAGLVEAFERAEADKAVRVALIHGTNECFTAGNDLQDFMNAPPKDDSSPVIRFLKTIHAAKKPIVAAVAGPAVGIGTTLLLHCDLIYADPKARLQLPFVNLGLCPEAGSSFLLPQILGHPRAAELLLFGDPFSAADRAEFRPHQRHHAGRPGHRDRARKSQTPGRAADCLTARHEGTAQEGPFPARLLRRSTKNWPCSAPA